MTRVLISDPLGEAGVTLLKQSAEVDIRTKLSPAELIDIIPEYDGLVVRSETKVTGEVINAATRLQVVGRAGVGVDNIDLAEATRRGIAVVNAPTGNTLAAAEHAITLMLALSRHVAEADASLRRGEWRRGDFMGVEVRNKTLGIIGLGHVGSEVAKRAIGFGMRLVGYDPYVSEEYARHLSVEVISLDSLLEQADFITLHSPLTETTRNLISEAQFKKMKPGARIINAARGGLIDESALLKALNEGRIAGAALDVFETEPPGESPLLTHPLMVATPHLGGSTTEAQAEVATEVAEQVLDVLSGRPARFTVNMPVVPPEVHAVVAPYLETASTIGTIAMQLSQGQFTSITIHYQGEIANYDTSILNAGVLVGLLGPVTEERLNLVNAGVIANQRGLKVIEEKDPGPGEYSSMITLRLQAGKEVNTIAGTLLRNSIHIVRINDNWLDLVPSAPYMLFVEHYDRPGMIGALGTIAGNHDINIAFMVVGRQAPRGAAVMVVGLDDPVPDDVLNEVLSILHIASAKVVKL